MAEQPDGQDSDLTPPDGMSLGLGLWRERQTAHELQQERERQTAHERQPERERQPAPLPAPEPSAEHSPVWGTRERG